MPATILTDASTTFITSPSSATRAPARDIEDPVRFSTLRICRFAAEESGSWGDAMLNKTINAAVYEKHGNPADVLHVETRPWPTPATNEAVVKMYAAPINPADLNQIEGKYPVRPELHATPGFEGAGVGVELGRGMKGLTSGALVILPHNVGTWRDAVGVKAEELIVVPDAIEPVQAAMLKINPLTAWRLIHDN